MLAGAVLKDEKNRECKWDINRSAFVFHGRSVVDGKEGDWFLTDFSGLYSEF
jgi:hypothetical protein